MAAVKKHDVISTSYDITVAFLTKPEEKVFGRTIHPASFILKAECS